VSIDPRFIPLLWAFGLFSPVLASIAAVFFYGRHRRTQPDQQGRISVTAYVSMLLICAVIAFAVGLQFGVTWACSSGIGGNLCGLVGFFIIAPLSAALAIFVVGASILLLRGRSMHPVTTWKISSAYLKLWRGQYSLGQSFWGFFILGTCIAWIAGIFGGLLFVLYPPTLPVFRLLFLGYLITAAVGVWRSSGGAGHDGAQSRTFIESAKSIGARTTVVAVVLALTFGGKIALWLHALR
jgi:hypothetical protein